MAKRTISELLSQVRYILQDTVATSYRYPDADLLAHFNSAIYELKRLRPDVWLGLYGEDLPMYSTAYDLTTTEIPFPSIFFQPVVLFVAGYAELRDDEFTVDNRAVGLVRSFSQQISAPSARG